MLALLKQFSHGRIQGEGNSAQRVEPNIELSCLQLADQRLPETSCISQFLLGQALIKPKTSQIARQNLPRGMNVPPNHEARDTFEALAIYT